MSEKIEAPGDLERVRLFVNTLHLEDGADALDSPKALVRWLAQWGWCASSSRASSADLAMAHELRAAIRGALLLHNGEPYDGSPIDVFERVARTAAVELTFEEEGAVLRPAAKGVRGGLGELLVLIAEAMNAGTWSRLKACRAETCQWAYYDHAKNRSRVWCSMKVCGNRTKVKAYRERRSD